MLDAIGAGIAPRVGDKDWADIWLQSPEYQQMRLEIEEIKRDALARPEGEKRKETACRCILFCGRGCVLKSALDATPFWYQLKEVVRRNNRALWRSPQYVFSRLFVHAFISLFVSLSFLQLGNGARDLQYRVFGM